MVGGLVAPERILAVTFTEAAASELKERIRFELVKRDRIEDALKLEESYISTIHGFGLRILTEFAFEGGISPSPRLLNDDEQGFLIRRTLPKTGKADAVAINLRKFGYRYDPVNKTGAEDVFLGTLLSLIDRLRSLGRKGEDPVLVSGAVETLRMIYGKTGNADALNRALHGAVGRLLKRFPGDLSPGFEGNASASGDFRENFRSLRRAEDLEEVASDWGLWLSLRKLRVAGRGGKVPPGYEDLAGEVMTAAAGFPSGTRGRFPTRSCTLRPSWAEPQDCLGSYGEEKRKASLVDFPDMLAGSHEILAKRPDVLAILKGRVDCLVIDEFQDTNPLQFSLLWKIREAGVPALVVGDVKQSIMGFQNADPRLFEQLEKQYPKSREPLTFNLEGFRAPDGVGQRGGGRSVRECVHAFDAEGGFQEHPGSARGRRCPEIYPFRQKASFVDGGTDQGAPGGQENQGVGQVRQGLASHSRRRYRASVPDPQHGGAVRRGLTGARDTHADRAGRLVRDRGGSDTPSCPRIHRGR